MTRAGAENLARYASRVIAFRPIVDVTSGLGKLLFTADRVPPMFGYAVGVEHNQGIERKRNHVVCQIILRINTQG